MTAYDGDGEFVAGAFRSIRAFSQFGSRLKSLSYSQEFEIGVENKAKCERYFLDKRKVSLRFGVPVLDDLYVKHTQKGTDWLVVIRSKTVAPIEIEVTVDDYNTLLTKNTHEAPQIGCRCGFYSFYTKERMFSTKHMYIPIPMMCVYGVVENSGRVVHCEYGLRSEKMKVLGVAPYSHIEIDALIKKFPLDVFEG